MLPTYYSNQLDRTARSAITARAGSSASSASSAWALPVSGGSSQVRVAVGSVEDRVVCIVMLASSYTVAGEYIQTCQCTVGYT